MGGVEAYVEALAKILSETTKLHALCVLKELAVRLEACGVQVLRIPSFSRFRPLRFLLAIAATAWLLLRFRIEVVQVNGLLESILLFPTRLLGRKAVYTRHGPFELDLYHWFRQPHKYFPRLIARHTAHLASRLVCVSETVGALCAPLFPPHQLSVIPNWISKLPPPRLFPPADQPIRILCAGRLEKYKGVQLLLQAVEAMPHVAVTIVGDGAYRATLESRAATNVTFAGFHPDPTPFYRDADIFVLPSFGPEGLPMVALEAMAHTLACLFSDLPVHHEITAGGEAALLFQRGSAADLQRKLQVLVDDAVERKRLAQNAYHLVQRKYHEPSARKAYQQLFAALTHPPSIPLLDPPVPPPAMARMATFSLIVPTVGRTQELTLLFQSLAAQQPTQPPAQQCVQIELILVDQNQDNRLQPLLALLPPTIHVQHLRLPERNVSRARNLGLAHATGDILAFPDDDCSYPAGLLPQVEQWFQAHPDYQILATGAVDHEGLPSGNRWPQDQCDIRPINSLRTTFCNSLFLKRSGLPQGITWDETITHGEETDYILRLLKAGCRGRFDRSLRILHPRRDMLSGTVTRTRAIHYGAGMGRLVRRHSLYPLWFLLLAYDLLRAILVSLRGRMRDAVFCFAHAEGLVRGFLWPDRSL
jgi:glycosyltransferase involved in cell wall biosynthesis